MEPLHDNEEARVADAAEIEDPEAAARAERRDRSSDAGRRASEGYFGTKAREEGFSKP